MDLPFAECRRRTCYSLTISNSTSQFGEEIRLNTQRRSLKILLGPRKPGNTRRARRSRDYRLVCCFKVPSLLMSHGPKHFKIKVFWVVAKGLCISRPFYSAVFDCYSCGRMSRKDLWSVVSETFLEHEEWPDLLFLIQSALNNTPSWYRAGVFSIKVMTVQDPSTLIRTFFDHRQSSLRRYQKFNWNDLSMLEGCWNSSVNLIQLSKMCFWRIVRTHETRHWKKIYQTLWSKILFRSPEKTSMQTRSSVSVDVFFVEWYRGLTTMYTQ